MTILGLIAVSIYGVVVLGARSAASGERAVEKARRLRVATDLVVRQLRSTVPLKLPSDGQYEAFFYGEREQVDFVTAAPQKADASGLAVVRYRFFDGTLSMLEVPLFEAVADEENHGLDEDAEALAVTLLYDVKSVEFGYRRDDGDGDNWEDEWDAAEEDELPNVVSIRVEPEADDGPNWYHEIPIFVGVFNEISGEEDFRRRGRTRVPPGERSARGRGGDDGDDDDDDDDDDD